jgi:tRNA (guanine-N7-)-methyltransferase
MPSKLEKFADFEKFRNCFSMPFHKLAEGFPLKGKWKSDYFGNENPLVLELGCGRGEYTVGLAGAHRNRNYVGMDIKGNRMWTGASEAIQQRLNNVAFLRARIDFIDHCFAPGEVSEIWITFPDPQPQKPRERKRLTHPRFLDLYRRILGKDGIVHLKTDSSLLYKYTLAVIDLEGLPLLFNFDDLYAQCPAELSALTGIKTYYERLFTEKGETIRYVCFRLQKET